MTPLTDTEKLYAIFEALAESLTDASDEEILEEARAQGLNPEIEAERVRSLMLQTVREYRRKAK